MLDTEHSRDRAAMDRRTPAPNRLPAELLGFAFIQDEGDTAERPPANKLVRPARMEQLQVRDADGAGRWGRDAPIHAQNIRQRALQVTIPRMPNTMAGAEALLGSSNMVRNRMSTWSM